MRLAFILKTSGIASSMDEAIEMADLLPPAEALAYQVLAGEREGGEFDWSALSWKKPR